MKKLSELYLRLKATLQTLVSDDLLSLAARLAIAATFWLSGRTKVTGLLSIKDSTFTLFQYEYALPLIPSEPAAYLATYAEHLFPLLLIVGFMTRFSALALLSMTAVIQVFVYPDAWPTHATWAVAILLIIAKGSGRWSLDRLFKLD